jgi:general stress protein YciG
MPSSTSGSERDFTSSNEERQSELTNESGRTLPSRGRSNENGNGARSASSSVEREEPRQVVVEGRNAFVENELTSSRKGRNGTSHRGFAAMDQQKQREIASKGGRAAHVKGTAHQWSSDEARAAGRKGGETVSQNREHMSAIGRRGGEARGQRASNGNGNGRSFE